MWIEKGSNVRVICLSTFPKIEGEFPYQRVERFYSSLGISSHHLQTVGMCVEVVEGGYMFIDWQSTLKSPVFIPKAHLVPEYNLDKNDVPLTKGEKVYIAVKNEIKEFTYIGQSKWKHHGYGCVALGAQFIGEDGKKFSHFHANGRVCVKAD